MSAASVASVRTCLVHGMGERIQKSPKPSGHTRGSPGPWEGACASEVVRARRSAMSFVGAIFLYFTAKEVDPLCVGSAASPIVQAPHHPPLASLAEAGLSGCHAACKGWRVGAMGRKWVQPR